MVAKYPEHIALEEAWKLIESAFKDIPASYGTEADISKSLGLVLSRDITAQRNVPHYAASAVDGYALKASCTIGASSATPVYVTPENYAWMNTGGDIPSWSDSVLMVEDSSMDAERLMVFKTLTPSANVRPLGEECNGRADNSKGRGYCISCSHIAVPVRRHRKGSGDAPSADSFHTDR